ncbi:MAG: Gfo/Idh/MocA family oxidoreductase, partial [Actinomycetota bacterium]|nr:Gfo/Idh/MocA family oxidoreductase [Actinomycetota bacterium]
MNKSPQPPIRWGISSTGRIARKFVAGLRLLDDAVVVAVGSRTQATADDFAETHRISRAHGSLEALAADPDVDVVYVSSTANAHCEQTIAYLEAGKPVLCEKPFAVNSAEVRRMVDTATANGVFLMEAMWSRFLPGYGKLRELLDEGRIGRPLHIDAEFAFNVSVAERAGNRLFDPARLGGGLVDLGIYPIHLCHFVLGEPSEVHATAVLEGGVDVQTSVSLGWTD